MFGRIGGRFSSRRRGGRAARVVSAVAALALAAGLVGASGCTLLTDFDKDIQKEDAGANALTVSPESEQMPHEAAALDRADADAARDRADDAALAADDDVTGDADAARDDVAGDIR